MTIMCNQQIIWLQIAMDHMKGMQVFQRKNLHVIYFQKLKEEQKQ